MRKRWQVSIFVALAGLLAIFAIVLYRRHTASPDEPEGAAADAVEISAWRPDYNYVFPDVGDAIDVPADTPADAVQPVIDRATSDVTALLNRTPLDMSTHLTVTGNGDITIVITASRPIGQWIFPRLCALPA
jgi:hypothetical protein